MTPGVATGMAAAPAPTSTTGAPLPAQPSRAEIVSAGCSLPCDTDPPGPTQARVGRRGGPSPPPSLQPSCVPPPQCQHLRVNLGPCTASHAPKKPSAWTAGSMSRRGPAPGRPNSATRWIRARTLPRRCAPRRWPCIPRRISTSASWSTTPTHDRSALTSPTATRPGETIGSAWCSIRSTTHDAITCS